MKHCRLTLSLSSLCALAWPAQAQSGTPAVERLAPVQIQGSAAAAPSQDSAVKRIVTPQELLRMNDERLADALRRLPGLTVTAGRPGQPDLLSLRGMGAGRTQVLVNGRRVPPGFSLDDIAPEQVARVEILQGNSASLSGEALAGSVNIVLKPAARQRVRRWQAGAGVQTGSAGGHHQRVQLQQGDALPAEGWTQGLTLTASQRAWRQRVDEDFASPDASRRTGLRVGGRARQLQLAPQLGWSAPGGHQLNWSNQLEWGQFRRGVDFDIHTREGQPPAWPVHADRYAQHRQTWRSELDGRWLPAPGWQAQGSVGVSGLSQHSRFSDQASGQGSIAALDDLTLGRLQEQGRQVAASLAWDATLAHTLTLGLSWNRQWRTELRDQTLSGQPVSTLVLQAGQQRQAWYVQDDWELSPTHQLTLGWRQEQLRLHSEDLRQRQTLALPSVQWLWRLPQGQWRTSVSRGFRAPALMQLQPRPYTSTHNTPLDPDQEGNPALRPERAWALDLQFQPKLARGQRLSLGGFLRRIEDPMVTVTRWRVGELGAERWLRAPTNAPRAWARGLELELQWPLAEALSRWLPAAGPATFQGWVLDAQATRTWTRVQGLALGPADRDLQLSDFQPLTAQLGLQGPWTSRGSWRLAYAWRHGGWRQLAPGERSLSPSGNRLDLMLQRKLDSGWQLSAHVEGLLQRDPHSQTELRTDLPAGSQLYRGSARSASPIAFRLGLQGGF